METKRRGHSSRAEHSCCVTGSRPRRPAIKAGDATLRPQAQLYAPGRRGARDPRLYGAFLFSRDPETQQNDAAAPGSLAGRHQLLRPGALPLPAGRPHPGRLHQLHAAREGGAASGHPEQAAVQRAQRRRELRRLQLGPRLGAPLRRLRGPERGHASGAREEEETEGEEQGRRRQVPQQEEGEDGDSAAGVGEAGERQQRPEGSDRGSEAAEAAAGLHAQPAPADLHRPGPERPDARGREEPLPPAHQGEHLAAPQPLLLLLLLHHLHLLVHVPVHVVASGRRTPDPRSHPLSRAPMSDRLPLSFLRLCAGCRRGWRSRHETNVHALRDEPSASFTVHYAAMRDLTTSHSPKLLLPPPHVLHFKHYKQSWPMD